MCLMTLFIAFFIIIHTAFVSGAEAGPCRHMLTDREMELVRESKGLLRDVDPEPLQETAARMNQMDCPGI